jgi:fructose-bisphosphate aldolase class II
MRLVPMKQLMDKAHAGGYAVPAFNVSNMEMMQAILWTAAQERSPVILGIHPVEVAYYKSAATAVRLAEAIGDDLDIDVAIHLDHGATRDDILGAIRGGFTSVMYDGSEHPLDENIAESKWVVDVAHRIGVTVEAEIGTIGNTDEFGAKLENAHLSDPVSAQRMAEAGIDCLAVAVGNAHGFYKGEPKLRFDILEQIVERVKIPLVLHGGTGIPKAQVRRAIEMGVAKMNVGAALRYAFVTGMASEMKGDFKELSHMTVLGSGRKKLVEPIVEYMDICNSLGKLDG